MKNTTMKMTKMLAAVLFLLAAAANAQVGVGTTSPNAGLDVRSSSQSAPANTDGILIPKVDAFPATNPTALQQGMLVYLTTLAGANQPGFYYWNNPTVAWIGLGSTATNGWSLTGNATTTPGTNFIGTTDDKDVVFKRNNVRSGYIGDPVYATGFIYNNGNTSFGANSLVNPGVSISPQRGVRNSAFGTNVMPSLTLGVRNVGIGDAVMYSNTTGSENTAVGVGALYSNTISSSNVAIGRNALTSATGGNNTGIGFASLRTVGSGTNNTALGSQAGYLNTGSSSVFLGNDAGYFETASNRLYINNSNADAVNSLVYGEFDNKKFRINGEIQVNNQATTGYKLPTARGTANQVLTTDGTGATSWNTPAAASTLSVMRASLNFSCVCTAGDQVLAGSGWEKIQFNTSVYDTNSEFNTGTNQFKPTRAGYYEIHAAYHIRTSASTNLFSIGVRVNGTVYQQEQGYNHTGIGMVSRSVTTTVYLNGTTDYVEIYAEGTAAGATIDSFPGKTFFEAIQVR